VIHTGSTKIQAEHGGFALDGEAALSKSALGLLNAQQSKNKRRILMVVKSQRTPTSLATLRYFENMRHEFSSKVHCLNGWVFHNEPMGSYGLWPRGAITNWSTKILDDGSATIPM
jgi:hypothetical protein